MNFLPKLKTNQVAVIAFGYISVGVAGYAAFPTTVGGNVLNSFAESDGLMQGVRGVVGTKFFFLRAFSLAVSQRRC